MTAESDATSTISIVLGSEAEPRLIRWTTWWASPASYDSYALITAGGAILVDPEALTPAAEARLLGLLGLLGAPPRASVLTNDMHERAAYALRERWGTPVWGPAYGTPDRGGRMDEGTPDRLYGEGDTLPGGLRVHKLEGGAFAGDGVLIYTDHAGSVAGASAGASAGERVLFTGDALNGPFNRANPNGPHPRRGEPGLYLGAGPAYLDRCRPAALKASLRALLSEPIALICGSHGDPYAARPNDALGRLLDLDWAPLIEEKRHPVVR